MEILCWFSLAPLTNFPYPLQLKRQMEFSPSSPCPSTPFVYLVFYETDWIDHPLFYLSLMFTVIQDGTLSYPVTEAGKATSSA
jgi:hypothetical protein